MNKKRLSASLALLFLAFVSIRAQTPDHKLEVGAQFSLLNRSPTSQGTIFSNAYPNAPGFGGRVGYSPSRFWSLEAELNLFPEQDDDFGDINGSKTQGLFGIKAGSRFEKFGVFGKVRPGFIRFQHVTDCPEGTISSCNNDGKTKLALDLGGVVEYYPTERTAVRVDFGDTIIWYGSVTLLPFFPELSSPVRVRHGTTNNFQFSAGFSFRF